MAKNLNPILVKKIDYILYITPFCQIRSNSEIFLAFLYLQALLLAQIPPAPFIKGGNIMIDQSIIKSLLASL